MKSNPIFQKKYLIVFVLLFHFVSGIAQEVNLDTANVLPPRYNINKKIIEMGWGTLDPIQVRDNMDMLSLRPVDGIVFKGKWPYYVGHATASIFTPKVIEESFLELDTLASIKWSKNLTDNFLGFLVCRDYADWFDDAQWNNVVANAKLISKMVVASKAKGIFLDTEDYGDSIWIYDNILYPNYSLVQVQEKVRQRGKEFMQALQTYSPDIKVFCTGAWVFTSWDANGNIDNIANTVSCLLKSFCDGMIEGATQNAKLIDGNEIAYYWPNTINWFYSPGAYKEISDNSFIAPEIKNKTLTNMQVSHGFYLNTCYPISEDKNKKRLEHHIYQELLWSDEYMWFYTEEGTEFWLNPFPPIIDSILLSAKNKIALGQELGFTIKNDTLSNFSNDLKIISPTQNQVFNVGDTIEIFTDKVDTLNDIYYYLSYERTTESYSPTESYKVKALRPGTYLVFALSNGYSKMSNPVTFYVKESSTQVKNIEQEIEVIIYPNPSNIETTLQTSKHLKNAKITVSNIFGQIVEETKNLYGQNFTILGNKLPAGQYFIRILENNKLIATKTIIIN